MRSTASRLDRHPTEAAARSIESHCSALCTENDTKLVYKRRSCESRYISPASIPPQFTHVFRDPPQRRFCRSTGRTSREGTLDQRLPGLLRKQAKAIRDRKEDAAFFNPCVFEPPPGSSGYRKIDYFRQSSFLVLDFDDGNLSPEEFERIFWHEARRGQKRSFVICNSFSRSPDKPNKFRVLLFYKRPAMSLFQHKAVLESVVARLEKHGYSKQSAKLDPACWSGVQSFYVPCTNRDHQEWAFFRTHGTKGRDIERCAFDPVLSGITYIHPNPVLAAPLKPVIVSSVSREQIDAATAQLRSLTEDRHQPIFDTALALCRLGLSSTEVESELVFAVGSDSRMRRKVSDAMKSLERYGWFSWRRWLSEAAAPHPFVGAG